MRKRDRVYRRSRDKVDNSLSVLKIHMRKKFLPEKARVLDLFCGEGEMYHSAYKGNVEAYHGVDKKKIHDSSLCTLEDNKAWLKTREVEGYNVFDLDDYGSPWALIYLLLSKVTEPELTLFVTDGTLARMRLSGEPTKIVSATSKVPMRMNVPGLPRWYEACFKTMLADAAERNGYEIERMVKSDNRVKDPNRTSVYCWAIKLTKLTNA